MSDAPGPSRFVVVKDALLLGVGLGGIVYQTVTGDVNPILTGVFMAMLGLPGVSGVISAVRSTTPPSSPPPAQQSSSQPSESREA